MDGNRGSISSYLDRIKIDFNPLRPRVKLVRPGRSRSYKFNPGSHKISNYSTSLDSLLMRSLLSFHV